MQIRLAKHNDQELWDAYVLKHPRGTAYQLFAWKKAVEQTYGFLGQYFMAESESGVCGILPLIDFRVPLLGRKLISLPYCDVGGVLADEPSIEESLLMQALQAAREIHADMRIRSISEISSFGPNRTDKVSMILALPENSEKLLGDLKAKVRSQVKKPLRDGLTAQIGHSELFDEFYEVFTENMHDLGSPVHAPAWLKAIVACYGENARIAIVYNADKRPAAAGIILLHSKTVSIPWASSLREFNRLNPNMLLYWTFLAFAADNGYRWFDFGRSTPGEGTYRFKQQWGAEPRPLYWYQLPSPKHEPGKRSHSKLSAKRDFACRAWQCLPLGVANTLGPRLRKYISL